MMMMMMTTMTMMNNRSKRWSVIMMRIFATLVVLFVFQFLWWWCRRMIISNLTLRSFLQSNIIKLNMMFGTTRTTACRERLKHPRYLTHITHFYDELAPISVFTLGSIYDNGWHWLKCRKLNFVSWRISAWPSRKLDGHHPRIGLITVFLHFCWSTSTFSIWMGFGMYICLHQYKIIQWMVAKSCTSA